MNDYLYKIAIFGQEYAKEKSDKHREFQSGILEKNVNKDNWDEDEGGYLSDSLKGWNIQHMYGPGEMGTTGGAVDKLFVDENGMWDRIYFAGFHSISRGSFPLVGVFENKKEIYYTTQGNENKWEQ